MARKRKVCRVSPGSLARAARKEHREHPWTTLAQARQIARDHLCGARSFGAYTLKMTDPATMTGSQINAELDRLDRESSKITDEFIATGRGHEKPSETQHKTDPLAMRSNNLWRRQADLRFEMSMRYGPGAPSRLPRGFGPRQR